MDILKDLGIGIPSGLKPSEKQNLANIVNSALSNSDTTKTNMINTINSKFGTSLTLDKNWADIQSVLSGVTLGKKFASGNLTVTNTTKNIVSNLGFTPSIVWVYTKSDSSGNYALVLVNTSYYGKQYYQGVKIISGLEMEGSTYSYVDSTLTDCQIIANGFTFTDAVGGSGFIHYWIAYE